MVRRCILACGLAALALSADASPFRTYKYRDDPLPSGAVLRLGSRLWWSPARLTCGCFSPDGKHFATGGADGAVRLWDVATGRQLARLQFDTGFTEPQPIRCLAFSPDSRFLAVPAAQGPQGVLLWHVQSHKLFTSFKDAAPAAVLFDTGSVTALAFAPDGKTLAAGTASGSVRLVDTGTGLRREELDVEDPPVAQVVFSPDSKLLAVNTSEKLHVWEMARPRLLHTVKASARAVCAFSKDGKTLSYRERHDSDEFFSQLDVATGKVAVTVRGGEGEVVAGPDGRLWLVPRKRYPEYARDIFAQKNTGDLDAVRGETVVALALAPDGKTLALAISQQVIQLWDITTGKEITTVPDHREGISHLSLSADGKTLATSGRCGHVCIWDRATGTLLRTFFHPRRDVACGISADASLVAAAGGYDVIVWETGTGKERKRWELPGAGNTCALFVRGGTALVTCDWRSDLLLWDVAGGKLLDKLTGQQSGGLKGIALTPDGKTLAASGWVGVCLWDTDTGKFLRSQGDYWRYAVAWSPDGRYFAAVTSGGVQVVDAATCQVVYSITSADGKITALAFSPDGRTLAVGTDQNVVSLWETASGLERRHWPGHVGAVTCVAFEADGEHVISASLDNTLLVWSARELKHREPLFAGKLTRQDLDQLWSDLGRLDGSQAYDAVLVLTRLGEAAVPYFKEQIGELKFVDTKMLQQWIADLDSPKYPARAKAMTALKLLGHQAETALRDALTKNPSLELRRRIEILLKELNEADSSKAVTAQLRLLRMCEVLERVGSPAAQAVLQSIAHANWPQRITSSAQEALARLARKK
jgi:WD40 repeat protein